MILTVKYIVQKSYTPSFQNRVNVVTIINIGQKTAVRKIRNFPIFSYCLPPCDIYRIYTIFII